MHFQALLYFFGAYRELLLSTHFSYSFKLKSYFFKLRPFTLNNIGNLKCSEDRNLAIKLDFRRFNLLQVAIRLFSKNTC